MGFKNRVSDNIQRKKLHIESIETDAGGNIKSMIVVGIERLDQPIVEGTKLEAKSILRALAELDPTLVTPGQLIEIEPISNLKSIFVFGSNETKDFEFTYIGGEVDMQHVHNDYFTITSQKANNIITISLTPKPDMPNITYQIEETIDIIFIVDDSQEIITNKALEITLKPNSTNPND